MATREFSTKTSSQLVAILAKLEDEQLSGVKIISSSAIGVSASGIVTASNEQLINRIKAELYYRDPSTYASYAICIVPNRTKAIIYGS